MTRRDSLKRFRELAGVTLGLTIVGGTFAGCGGASSPDEEPTAPPVTAESLETLTKDIDSQRGGMKPLQ